MCGALRQALHVQVSASSPSCKFTDAKVLTSRKFVRVNMACPNRQGASWWQADLGVHHSLACNYYTVRADASGNFIHDWELQVLCYPLAPVFAYKLSNCQGCILSCLPTIAMPAGNHYEQP
jgi:hypothetical protein